MFKKLCLIGGITLSSFLFLLTNTPANFSEKLDGLFKQAFAQEELKEEQRAEYAPGEVLIGLKEGAAPQAVLEEVDIEIEAVGRIHSIKPAVARFKKTYENIMRSSSKIWFWSSWW